MKFKVSGIASLLTALSLALPTRAPAQTDSGSVELPDRSVIGKKPGSRYKEILDRSRDVLNFKPRRKLRDPNVAAAFVGEGLIPGAQLWMYPAGSGFPLPSLTDAQAAEGKYSLEVTLKADAYAGGAVCSPAPLDLSPYLEKGVLEAWIKGAEGKEVFSIGMLDNGSNPMGRPLQVWVSSRSYAKVTQNEWRRVRVPLKAFGGRGSFWSEEQNARISSNLNWKAISCFSFDIDKERHKTFKVWMDNVTVYKVGPKGAEAAGEGYALSNEAFEDFPGSGLK